MLVFIIVFYARARINKHRRQKELLLNELDKLKSAKGSSISLNADNFQLDVVKIEQAINRKMNETDWKVLNILLEDPVISNKGIAEKAFLSVNGIASSLRRMYFNFDIKESKYMKISLIMAAIKISNRDSKA